MKMSYEKMMKFLESGLVPFMEGPAGEGKTTYAKEFAKSLGKEIVIMNLSAVESTDFCGLPYIETEGNHRVTKYAKPSFLNAEILFLDEIDRVRDSAVKASLLSLFVDKKINGHELNPNCIILAAGNGLSDEYETVEFDKALESRIGRIKFAYSTEQKISYFNSKYAGNDFVKFMEVKPEILSQFPSRRIENLLKTDIEFCELILDKETARLFQNFVASNLVTLADIKAGKVNVSKLGPLTVSSLILDVVNDFFSLDANDAKNVNAFINAMNEEQKSVYMTKLKSVCMKNHDGGKFETKARELDAAGFFKGQKSFLAELTK